METQSQTIVAMLSLIAAVISAIAAWRSASTAASATRIVEKQRDEDLLRESERLANQVVSDTMRLDSLSRDLRIAIRTQFASHGRSSGFEPLIADVAANVQAMLKMQKSAREFIEGGDRNNLPDRIRTFEQNLVHLNRVKESWLEKLGEARANTRHIDG